VGGERGGREEENGESGLLSFLPLPLRGEGELGGPMGEWERGWRRKEKGRSWRGLGAEEKKDSIDSGSPREGECQIGLWKEGRDGSGGRGIFPPTRSSPSPPSHSPAHPFPSRKKKKGSKRARAKQEQGDPPPQKEALTFDIDLCR